MYQFDDYIAIVDLGLSRKMIIEKLKEINIDLEMVNVILLTHEHSDHLKGADVLLKQYSGRFLTAPKTAKYIKTKYPITFISSGDVINLTAEIKLEVVRASHDAVDPLGFIFHVDNKKIVHLTDSGYIVSENYEKFKGAFSYTIESNYEEQVLIVSDKYPFNTKKRILSDKGHLSNVDCHNFLKENITSDSEFIQFAHLSENNNNPELVSQLNEELNINNKTVLAKDQIIKVELCK